MRTKLMAAAAVLGLVALVLAVEAVPSSAGNGENCDVPLNSPGFCAELQVTKVVTGTAPPGTTFPVQVVCPEPNGEAGAEGLPLADGPPVDKTLNLAAGETQGILLSNGTMCTISETPPAGCTVSIDRPIVEIADEDIIDQALFSVTVTNDCEVDAASAAAEPAAAEVVEAVPAFTG